MSFLSWITLAGVLFAIMALVSVFLKRLPFSSSIIYILLGLAISPLWLDVISIDFIRESVVFEHLAEVAVVISLFVSGLKLRLPLSHSAWVPAFLLAGPVMICTIAGVAAFSHLVFGFAWPVAFLLGAVLAPTDPVLASMVSVTDSRDEDRVRYGLTGEAGFNDGAAFPFVVFSLLWLEHGSVGEWVTNWALHRLAWAVPAGLLTGYFLGKWVARFAIHLRRVHPDTKVPNDFVVLALIALAYAAAEAIGAWGFLAAFGAGLGFRRTEVLATGGQPASDDPADHDPQPSESSSDSPAEHLANNAASEEEMKQPTQAVGHTVAEIMTLGNTAERLLEVMVVVLLGICLAVYWDWRALSVALVLFGVLRPLFTHLFLIGTRTRLSQRGIMGWFGIRGIGSIYYLAYALNHGLNDQAEKVVALTLSVVALSVAIHGISSPILHFYEKLSTRSGSRKAANAEE